MTTRLDDAISFALDQCKHPFNDVDFWWRLAGSLRKARDKAVEEAKWKHMDHAHKDGRLITVWGRTDLQGQRRLEIDCRYDSQISCFIDKRGYVVVGERWKEFECVESNHET